MSEPGNDQWPPDGAATCVRRRWSDLAPSRIVGPALALLLGVACPRPAPAQELVIADGGASAYRIVIGVDASIQDHHAAQELQRHVEEMSGVLLPIITDDNALVPTQVIVGFNAHTRRVAPDLAKASFGPEEFEVWTVGQSLLIVGGSPRGVPYGVTSVLTDDWGCRWFTPLLKVIPPRKRLVLGQTQRRRQPPFEWRDGYFQSGLDNEWAFHNFQNKDFARLRPEQGGRAGLSHVHFTHTALALVPPQRYLPDHPEYYWTGTAGQPRSGRTTTEGRTTWIGLCLRHPEVARIAAQSLLRARREQPEGDLYYGIAGSDYDDWCECPRCMEGYRLDGGPWPYGAAWLGFGGRLHELLKNEPGAPKLSVLAYGGSAVPPTTPLRYEPVNVLYASLEACQFHALDDPACPHSATFRQRLQGWRAWSESIYVWLYKMNFDHWCWVHPNLDTLAADLRYLREAGVRGLFVEGNQIGWDGQRFAGEFAELRAYVLARLIYDPDADWRALRREFCAAYYGAAAGAALEQYMDDTRKELVAAGAHGTASFGKEAYAWVTPQMLGRWYALLDRAESLADDDEHRRLVRIARLPIQFTEGSLAAEPAQRKALLQKFLDDSRALGAAQAINEGTGFPIWAEAEGLAWR